MIENFALRKRKSQLASSTASTLSKKNELCEDLCTVHSKETGNTVRPWHSDCIQMQAVQRVPFYNWLCFGISPSERDGNIKLKALSSNS
jgi:hypothetical protein